LPLQPKVSFRTVVAREHLSACLFQAAINPEQATGTGMGLLDFWKQERCNIRR
jgi:hypothetical protein